MPDILFASNSISHFPGSEIRSDAWSFDADRVPYAMYTPPATVVTTPKFKPSTTEETWIHFRAGATSWYVNNNERMLEVTDEDGNRICLITCYDRNTNGYYMYYQDLDQNFTLYKWIPVANNQMRTFDLRIYHGAITMQFDFYVNEALLLTGSFSTANALVPRYARFGGVIGNNDTVGMHFSEVIISDSDTRNARLDLLRPVAAGAYENFDGPLSSLADDDPTTGMTTTLQDQKQSTILSPYGGANNISNVVQVSTTVRGINSPDQLDHFIRMGGVDYPGAERFDVPFAKDYQVTDWKQNPATSAPWQATDLVGAEFGFESKNST